MCESVQMRSQNIDNKVNLIVLFNFSHHTVDYCCDYYESLLQINRSITNDIKLYIHLALNYI